MVWGKEHPTNYFDINQDTNKFFLWRCVGCGLKSRRVKTYKAHRTLWLLYAETDPQTTQEDPVLNFACMWRIASNVM